MVKFYTSTRPWFTSVDVISNVDKNHGSGLQRRSLKTWVEKFQCCSQRNWQDDLGVVSAYIYFCQTVGLIFFVCLNKPPLWERLEMLVCPELRNRHCWLVSWDKHPKAVSGSSCKMSLFFIFSSISSMKIAFTQWIKMQIYILFYEIETNNTHLQPSRVAIANINTVLHDDLSQMKGWNRNAVHQSLWNTTGKQQLLP